MFSTTKAFVGHCGVTQSNAIGSWVRLDPRPQVILFGDEPGTAEIARRHDIEHVPVVASAPSGAPLISELFARAEELARHQLLCYLNADIVVFDSFTGAVQAAMRSSRPTVMVGRRTDLDLDQDLGFGPDWQQELLRSATERGVLQVADAIDYLVFRRGVWGELPPFVVGRPGWDSWMVYRARALGLRVVDATADVVVVHQNHDYGHVQGGFAAVWKGQEAARNLELAGDPSRFFSIADASHVLRAGRVRRAFPLRSLRRRTEAWAVLYPLLRPLLRPLLLVADSTHHLRARFGLALNPTARRRAR
jgi:hypothetical protein